MHSIKMNSNAVPGITVVCGTKGNNASLILVSLYVSAFIADISVVNVIEDMGSPPASQ